MSLVRIRPGEPRSFAPAQGDAHARCQLHADQVDTDVSIVGRLLAAQFPQWADLRIERVHSVGTDNAIHRLGGDMTVRLPRIQRATGQVAKEHQWLPSRDAADTRACCAADRRPLQRDGDGKSHRTCGKHSIGLAKRDDRLGSVAPARILVNARRRSCGSASTRRKYPGLTARRSRSSSRAGTRTSSNKTPAEVAESRGHETIAALLRE
jgi:hypothetical protein